MARVVVVVDRIPDLAWLCVSIHEGGEMVGTHLGRRCRVGDGGGRRMTWCGGKAISNWIVTQVTAVIISHTSLNQV